MSTTKIHYDSTNSDKGVMFETMGSEQGTEPCTVVINSPCVYNHPEVSISECGSTSIAVTSEIDPEVQHVAQLFVDDLILKARKEAISRTNAMHRVI